MSLITAATRVIERVPLPDSVTAAGISYLVDRTSRRLAGGTPDLDADFAALMASHPVAVRPDAANAQHYEVPAAFFDLVLGPRRKYSCCLYRDGADSLEAAEENALAETVAHAQLADGQDILELGCGWGSLSLWMAETLPRARITAVSNSRSQRQFIEDRAAARGLTNLTVLTADMNDFATDAQFDRVVSVEMFEHMTNWGQLLGRVRGWLKPEGRLFLHVFSHRSASYRFDATDPNDWIAQHFFTGGIMPSHGLIRQFGDLFELEADRRWSGAHYARTAEDWLANYDRNADEIGAVLRDVYGDQAKLWGRRWRLFFLATSGLFGHAEGFHWGVSHYRLKPASGA